MLSKKANLLIAGFLAISFALPVLSKDSSSDRLIKPVEKKPEGKNYAELPPWGYEPRKADKRSKKGKNLYKKQNCRQCHSIKGRGGEVGPPLDGIGGHRGPEWLVDRLMDPEKQQKQFAHVFGNRPNIMPHPALTREEASYIVDYILTLPEPKGGYLVAVHAQEGKKPKKGTFNPDQPKLESALRGAELFYKSNCYTCHSTDGSKDRFGPDLAGIGSKIGEKQIRHFLKRASKQGIMKERLKGLSDKQLNDLKSFLLTIPDKDKVTKD